MVGLKAENSFFLNTGKNCACFYATAFLCAFFKRFKMHANEY